jgi:hypothetical protein
MVHLIKPYKTLVGSSFRVSCCSAIAILGFHVWEARVLGYPTLNHLQQAAIEIVPQHSGITYIALFFMFW